VLERSCHVSELGREGDGDVLVELTVAIRSATGYEEKGQLGFLACKLI
jgi:hypothetical protein